MKKQTTTEKANHTPGPWKVGTGWIYQASEGVGQKICGELPISEEGDANANLIAAAPDLLTALKELVAEWDNQTAGEDHHSGYSRDSAGVVLARAAIAKAEGR